MLLRLTGFLSGYAGVTPDLCRFLADRLNDGWYPVVPSGVSGAAGEIVPLAHLFGTLVGDGSVFSSAGPVSSSAGSAASSGGSITSTGLSSRPEAVDAGTALAQTGVSPYELEAKEGIALINGAPLAPALAVPLALRAEALLDHATLCWSPVDRPHRRVAAPLHARASGSSRATPASSPFIAGCGRSCNPRQIASRTHARPRSHSA